MIVYQSLLLEIQQGRLASQRQVSDLCAMYLLLKKINGIINVKYNLFCN